MTTRKKLALAVAGSLLLTACSPIGSVTEDEFAAILFESGHIYGPDAIQVALHGFAGRAGYDSSHDLQIRYLTLDGDDFSIHAQVNHAGSPSVSDTMYAHTDFTMEHTNSESLYFTPEEIPDVVFRDPNLLFRNLREATEGQDVTSYSVTIRPKSDPELPDDENRQTDEVTLTATVSGSRLEPMSFVFDTETGEIVEDE